jgi:putative transposase
VPILKEGSILEGHLMPDHIHMLVSIPCRYSAAQVAGFIDGKSAIQVARTFGVRERNFTRQHFWARGYFVSTVGRDETVIGGTSQSRSRNTQGSID